METLIAFVETLIAFGAVFGVGAGFIGVLYIIVGFFVNRSNNNE